MSKSDFNELLNLIRTVLFMQSYVCISLCYRI